MFIACVMLSNVCGIQTRLRFSGSDSSAGPEKTSLVQLEDAPE
jgi:hypothetical protein